MNVPFVIAAAALAMVAPEAASAPPAVVPITLYSYGYTPAPIVLRAGQPVTLQLVNRSGSGHSFKAPKFFASARMLGGAVHDGEIDLKGGQSASVTLVPAAGTYPLYCDHFMHDSLGMHSTIDVR
jgi:plastocyanin